MQLQGTFTKKTSGNLFLGLNTLTEYPKIEPLILKSGGIFYNLQSKAAIFLIPQPSFSIRKIHERVVVVIIKRSPR